MEYVDFSALIQLGVVFNFAFIFDHLEPVKLFRKIFSNLNDDFRKSDKTIEHNITLLRMSFETLNVQDNIKSVFVSEIESLHRKIDLGRANIKIRLNMTPKYFQVVCLFLAIYSIFILFFIGDYKEHTYTLYAWSVFTICSILVIIYFFCKEILHFFTYSSSNQEKISYVRIVFMTIIIYVLSYIIVFCIDKFDVRQVLSKECLDKINSILELLKYISIFIPYVSFIVSFLLHSTSILYSRIKLFLYNKKINILRSKQNKLLSKIDGDNILSF